MAETEEYDGAEGLEGFEDFEALDGLEGGVCDEADLNCWSNELEEDLLQDGLDELSADVEPVEENIFEFENALGLEEPEEEDATAGVDVEEHLKESVEGNLRLKRLLSDDSASPVNKRLRSGEPEKDLKVKQILLKWGLTTEVVVRYCLENCSIEELEGLSIGAWRPDKNSQWKSVGDQLARHIAELRERKLPVGNALDPIAAFVFRYKSKIDAKADKLLRSLSHKDLRHVIANFDGSRDIQTLVQEAAGMEPNEDIETGNALPNDPGVTVLSRFTRLELIEPCADAAVFGDANLTFSLKLAKHRKALGHVGRVIATTFEELDTLRERYQEIDASIKVLEDHFAEVYHGVDCTSVGLDKRFSGLDGTLGAVYYNFPHSGAVQGFFDGHPLVNWRHENLMRLFFRALRSFVKPGGYVKVSSNMGAVGVRYSYIIDSALENEFLHIETVPFLEWHLHRYGRSYGDKRDVYKRPDATNNQSYNAQSAERDMVYCFCYAPTGNPMKPQIVRHPPRLEVLKNTSDGPFKNMAGLVKKNLADQLHQRFLAEASGTHVG